MVVFRSQTTAQLPVWGHRPLCLPLRAASDDASGQVGKNISVDPNLKTLLPQARVFREASAVSLPPLATIKMQKIPTAPGRALAPRPF